MAETADQPQVEPTIIEPADLSGGEDTPTIEEGDRPFVGGSPSSEEESTDITWYVVAGVVALVVIGVLVL